MPSPWLVLLPGFLLALVGGRAVATELNAERAHARDQAHVAAASLVRSVAIVAREFAEGLPAEGARLADDAALDSARHLFPRRLVAPDGGALRDAALAAPTDADRAFVTDALTAAVAVAEASGREAAAAFLASAAESAPGDPPRAPLRTVAAALAPAAQEFGGPAQIAHAIEALAADEQGWGDATRRMLLGAVESALDAALPPALADMLARDEALRDAAARADRTTASAVWIAPGGGGLAMGVVSARIVVVTGDGEAPARIAGDVPASVVRERVEAQAAAIAREGQVSISLVAPDGATSLEHLAAAAHTRPVVESLTLDAPFEAWRVDVVASARGGAPVTAWILAVAVVATSAALVWSVLALRRAVGVHARLAAERQTFLDHVAHEVRTPAGALLALSEELATGNVPAARQATYHAHLASEARRLARLVEDTLDLSRLDAGRLVFSRSPTDLRGVVAEGIAAAAAEDAVTFRAPVDAVVVNADAPALRRAVRNLVDNALRHGATEPRPEVTIERDADHARVVVRDHGPGIAPERIASVFERFLREPSATHEQKGVGVGLAICREIVRAHGGEMTVESRPGDGAAFTMRLPLERSGR